jgi:hypothetical protein
MAMARVVMLTSAAGPGLDLQFGDIFETDQTTADRLLELGSAREVTAEDEGAPVKREAPPVASGELREATEVASDELRDASEDEPEETDEPEEPAPIAAPVRRAATRRR